MTNLRKVSLIGLVLAIFVWGGVGVYYFKSAKPSVVEVFEDLNETHLIIGEFQSWEEIKGSEDRYVILTATDSGKLLPEIRVGFGWSLLFGDGESEDSTVFAVEKSEEKYDVLGYLKDFTADEIDELIKKGDFIKVVFKKEEKREQVEVENTEPAEGSYEGLGINRKNLKDENNNFLAHWFFIKREKGKQEVEQKLGRKIEKP